MSLRSVDSNVYDAWRVGCTLSVFLLSITTACLCFAEENRSALQRCAATEATKEECMLTVFGR